MSVSVNMSVSVSQASAATPRGPTVFGFLFSVFSSRRSRSIPLDAARCRSIPLDPARSCSASVNMSVSASVSVSQASAATPRGPRFSVFCFPFSVPGGPARSRSIMQCEFIELKWSIEELLLWRTAMRSAWQSLVGFRGLDDRPFRPRDQRPRSRNKKRRLHLTS